MHGEPAADDTDAGRLGGENHVGVYPGSMLEDVTGGGAVSGPSRFAPAADCILMVQIASKLEIEKIRKVPGIVGFQRFRAVFRWSTTTI